MTAPRIGVTMLVAVLVTGMGIGLYDRFVRQPRTPRIAVVDVARLFTAAERQAKAKLLAPGSTAAAGEFKALGELSQFGSAVETALQQAADDCECLLVAVAAVFGQRAAVPDYTAAIADRLGVELAPVAGRTAKP